MNFPYRFAPDSELLGFVGQSMLNNLSKSELETIVKKHNLDQLEPDKYYPVDNFVKAMAEITNTSNFVAIGMAVINNSPMPDDLDEWTLEEKFNFPSYAYQNEYFKDKTPGELTVRWINDSHVVFEENTVWPDDLIYGFIYSFSKRFLSDKYNFIVKYDSEVTRQELGGDRTLIHVTWEDR